MYGEFKAFIHNIFQEAVFSSLSCLEEKMKQVGFIVICIAGFLWFFQDPPASSENFPALVKKPVEESITIRKKTQKAEDKWAEERARLKAEYEKLEQENRRLTAENRELEKNVDVHKKSVNVLEHQIAEIERISEELFPFLEQTYSRLAALVEKDTPFLQDERCRRIAVLGRTLGDSQISISEKFRKVMEALTVEAEYGNTVEVYQERIMIDKKNVQVNIFRLGRLSLFFQSLDRKTTGYFDPAIFAWKKFPSHYNREINAAIEMGAKRRPVALLELPLGKVVVK